MDTARVLDGSEGQRLILTYRPGYREFRLEVIGDGVLRSSIAVSTDDLSRALYDLANREERGE